MNLEAVFQTIDELGTEEQKKIVEYIQRKEVKTQQLEERVLGLHAGAIWISDDFDHELPDSFWLGEE